MTTYVYYWLFSGSLIGLQLLFLLLNTPLFVYPVSTLLFAGIALYFMMTKKTLPIQDNPVIEELIMAKNVQQALMANTPPHINGIKLAKICIPAAHIGGDFITFLTHHNQTLDKHKHIPGVIQYRDDLQEHLGIIIGDVAGHGISSALVMALSSGILSEIGKDNASTADICLKANHDIQQYIRNSQVPYVTSFLASINLHTKLLTYTSAGHPPALYIHQKQITELATGNTFLGMFEDERYNEDSLQLHPGDRLVLYTDGITEIRDRDGHEFNLSRFKDLLLHHQDTPIDNLIPLIVHALSQFSGDAQPRDDQTLVIAEIS